MKTTVFGIIPLIHRHESKRVTSSAPVSAFTTGRLMKISILIFIACTIISAAPVHDNFYVNAANLTPVAPYDTWEKAATDIQTAIDAASKNDHVIVTNGVYSIGEKITPGYSLSNRVVITKNITVRSVNGPENTIILGAETPGGGKGKGAVRCVFMGAGKLYGFTISNGFTFASSASIYDLAGGGIFLTNFCSITNCIISGNTASHGGGVYCYRGGSLSACTINGNVGSFGGGVQCYYGGSVSDSTISGNSVVGAGGGVFINSDGAVFDCTINGNSADNGGGVYCDKGGAVSDCTISGNSARTDGGGVHVYSGGSVSACTISGNSADSEGGGVYYRSGGSASDCTISGNSANSGGGAYCYLSGALTNCLIYGMNAATLGGGAYLQNGGELFNCTIAGNYASDSGGGIVCSNGGKVINTIIYNNGAILGAQWFSYDANATFSYCCTTPTNNLPVGTYCTPENPMFENPGSDYHLSDGSPCIDVGLNMPWTMAPGATDLDGNPRIHDGIVDMGCYEFIPEPEFLWIMIMISCYFVRDCWPRVA
jgi:hypothetical protein